MKIKHLTRQGNSLAFIIDKPILELLDITEQTPLQLNVEGRKIVLEPVGEEVVERRFVAATSKVEKKFGPMFKKLAQK